MPWRTTPQKLILPTHADNVPLAACCDRHPMVLGRGRGPTEPRARCLKLAEWPEADRRGWQAAVATGDLLLDDGPGAPAEAGDAEAAPNILWPLALLAAAGGPARSGCSAGRPGDARGDRRLCRRAAGAERPAERPGAAAEPRRRPRLARPRRSPKTLAAAGPGPAGGHSKAGARQALAAARRRRTAGARPPADGGRRGRRRISGSGRSVIATG